MTDRPELWPTEKAAEYIGVAAITLKKMRNSGRGPAHIKISDRRIRYRREDLDAYLDSCRVDPKPAVQS